MRRHAPARAVAGSRTEKRNADAVRHRMAVRWPAIGRHGRVVVARAGSAGRLRRSRNVATLPGLAPQRRQDRCSDGREGDIDHLVATPSGLWVVETKSSFLPKPVFADTWLRIVANVEAVRDWAPPGVRVTGALAFAGDESVDAAESCKKGGAETIGCFRDAKSLMRVPRIEASRKGPLDPGVVQGVWKLGKRPEDDNPPAKQNPRDRDE